MSATFSKIEVITGVARRQRFTTEQKLSVVKETLQLGMSISYVARRPGLSPRSSSAKRRAPAAIPSTPSGLPADEEVRFAAGPAYRTARPACA